ncbi:MAG: hypothetical protein HOP25_00370 [Methylotenera sp.]|nr:hypothetical protein [Methylotenera sp.]
MISRILEEIFPFYSYLSNKNKLIVSASSPALGEQKDVCKRYLDLGKDFLLERITEEHQRAIKIDDKTIKFTLALSLSLSILGSTSALLANQLTVDVLHFLVVGLSGICVLYTLIAGLLALGAIQTLPTYGYGTEFLIASKNNLNLIAEALLSQEKINIVRQIRNEASYQCLRNGLLMLLIAILIFFIAKI